MKILLISLIRSAIKSPEIKRKRKKMQKIAFLELKKKILKVRGTRKSKSQMGNSSY